jgi:uncharacterized membrane protein
MLLEKINAKWFFLGLFFIILFTNISILISLPLYREIFTVICFLFFPGFLILLLFKIKKITHAERFVLSIGLSISFLILIGLIINFLLLYIGCTKPLSTIPISISFTIVLFIIIFFAYWRNKSEIYSLSMKSYLSNINSALFFSPVFFSLLFPFMSFFGTYLMNSYGNNILLLITYIIIPFYIVAIIIFNKKIPQITYPIAITMISIAVLISRSLTSHYLIGGDIYSEYYTSQVVQNNYHWDFITDPSMVMDSLGVSFLPTILHSLSGLTILLIFKFILILIISFYPLITYIICKKFLGSLKGFLASFLLIAQIPFINLLTGQLRVGLAIFFLSLFVMVLFENKYTGFNKKILLIIIGFSVVISYYVTPIIMLLMLFLVWLFQKLLKDEKNKRLTTSIIILLGAFLFFWWGLLSNSSALKGYSSFIISILKNFNAFFIVYQRNPAIQQMLFFSNPSVLTYITTILNDLIFLIIAIGIIYILISRKSNKKFEISYILLMFFSLICLASLIILPYVSMGYAPDRFLIQIFFIICPAFFIGCTYLFNRKKIKIDLKIISILLVLLFLFNSYFVHYIARQESSEIFDLNSQKRDNLYVYDAEVIAAEWVAKNHRENTMVFLGSSTQEGNGIFEYANFSDIKDLEIFSFRYISYFNKGGDYILLRYINLDQGLGYRADNFSFFIMFRLHEYNSYFTNTDKIYDNDFSEIYN